MRECDVDGAVWWGDTCAASVLNAIPTSAIVFIVVCLVLSSLIKYFTPQIKGWFGEWVVRKVLAKLPEEYQQWHDVYLLDSEGHTTQIDHLIASRYGIFAIETKNYKGWIFGSENQKTWTQSIYKKKSKFQNPLHQNARHIRVLAESSGLQKTHFHNVIYFIGEAALKTDLPKNVMTNGLREYIRYQNEEVFSAEKIEKFCVDIARLNLSKERGIGRRHVKSLRARKTV